MDIIGAAIKQLRTQKNISTYDLAKMTGIAQSTLSKLENGKRNADIEILTKIAKALDVDISNIIEGPKTLREILFDRIFEKNLTIGDLSSETNLDFNEIEEVLTIISTYNPDHLYKVCKVLNISKGSVEKQFEKYDFITRKHYGSEKVEEKLKKLFKIWLETKETISPVVDEIHTIAAHHDGEEWTEEELEEIENFKKYVLSKRNNK